MEKGYNYFNPKSKYIGTFLSVGKIIKRSISFLSGERLALNRSSFQAIMIAIPFLETSYGKRFRCCPSRTTV